MVDVCVRKRYRINGAVYEYRFEIASIDGKRKWKTKSGFKTVTDARQAGKLALRQYENFGHVVKDQISVADFLEDWLVQDCMVDLKPNTVTNYIKQVRIYLKPALGAYRLKSLTRELLQGFILKMYDNGFSFNSLIAIKGVLTKSMNYAVDNHYLVCSPAVRLKIPRYRIAVIPTRSSPHHYIPAEIMQKVFERFPERSSSFIPLKLGYECGLRLGEVFGLYWEDIDFENRIIRINRQVQWFADQNRDKEEKLIHNGSAECGKGFWYFSAPKYNSCRTIEISDELTDILKREQVRQERAKAYFGQYYSNYYADSAQLSGSELIRKARGTNSLRDRTVLFLTHDYQPIIDVYNLSSLFSKTNIMFLQNIDGLLNEVPIMKDDIKSCISICQENIDSETEVIIKLVYLRRFIAIHKR